MTKRIESAWIDYVEKCMPKEAGSLQRQETKRAFYSGAHALLTTIMGGLDSGTDATNDDLAMMNEIDAELKDFFKAVLDGKA